MALHEAMPPDSLLGPIEPLLDVARAAHFLGISVKTLRDWISRSLGLDSCAPLRHLPERDELMKDCVRFDPARQGNGKASGELTIKRGLKRRARKRKLVIDREIKTVLERLMAQSDCEYVFTSPQDPAKPLGPWVLEEQMAQLRKKIKTHADAGLHALRHTFLTEAGEYTDPFTLQYVAGHDNIKTTMRYVHPREEAVEKLFVRLGNLERPEGRVECKRSVQNPVQLEMPSDADLAKLLSTCNLRAAEVVELADTPS